MKNLRVEKKGSTYKCLADGALVYSGELSHKGSTMTLSLKNACQEEIIQATYPKTGFKLFRGNKPQTFAISMYEKTGSITPKDHSYEWLCNDIRYSFICGEAKSSIKIIMRDHDTILAYASKHEITLLHTIYSAEMCLFVILMLDAKDKVTMETSKFNNVWESAVTKE